MRIIGQTIIEKVFSKYAGHEVEQGEIVFLKPKLVLTHDNSANIIDIFYSTGLKKVNNPDQLVIVLDHTGPCSDIEKGANVKGVREFVKKQGIERFFDVGSGICHQIMLEHPEVVPGELYVGSDSHTTTYGALNAAAIGVNRDDAAAVWATGKTWFKVPESVRITLNGKLQKGVYAKDVILYLIGDLKAGFGEARALEFYGNLINEMSIDSRAAIANMSYEMDALAAIFPFDKKTKKFLKKKKSVPYTPVSADLGNNYAEIKLFDLKYLPPMIACPHKVDNVKSVSQLKNVSIDQAVLGSCTNGRLEDLAVAAEVVERIGGKAKVRFYVYPASQNVLEKAIRKGYIKKLVRAGAVINPCVCGPCLGEHLGLLADGERAISSTNRNFQGRMGSKQAEVYLASPAMVAYAAMKGYIADVREVLK